MACRGLIEGAYTTKGLALAAQASFYKMAETGNQALAYTYAGDNAQGAGTMQKFSVAVTEAEKDLDTVVSALQNDGLVDRSIINALTGRITTVKTTLENEYVPLIRKMRGIAAYQGNTAALDADIMRSISLSEQIGGELESVADDIWNAGEGVYTGYVNFLMTGVRNIRISVVVTIVLSLILVIVLGTLIRKPFKKIIESLQEISQNWDLTKQVAVKGRDESGQVAHYINMTFEKLRTLIQAMKKMSSSLENTGESLNQNIAQSVSSVTEITASLESIKKQVDSQGAEVDSTADSMARIMAQVVALDGNIAEQVGSVERSSQAVEEMAVSIRSVSDTLETNVQNIQSLADASNKGRQDAQVVVSGAEAIAQESEGLQEINAVIQNIASQTNLLSMNAAIEAAHAGEVGKGFAVVADEIRKLAENSSEQSKTISSILKKIKTSIEGITTSTSIMVQGFDIIEEGVGTVSRQESVIREAMAKQEAGSQNITDAMGTLKTIMESIKDSSGTIAQEGADIQQMANGLKQITAEIQNSMAEITAGAEQVSGGISGISEIGGKNKENIEALDGEIANFMVV
jgi:methyl-accepting chemotaxis protein